MGCTRSKYAITEPAVAREMVTEFASVDLDRLETGDIILFSSPNTITGRAIWAATSSIWTHCGVILKMEALFPGQGPFLLETNKSYSDNLIDFSTGTVKKEGTRLVRVTERLRESSAQSISFMKITRPKYASAEDYALRTKYEDRVLTRLLGKVSPLPYEKNAKELLFSAIDIGPLTTNEPDMSSVFCSELVAYTLRELTILGQSQSDNEYTPGDFARKKFKNRLATGYNIDGPFNLKTVYKK